MSTKDKAREKLLNSMRKTKAVISDQPDSKQAHADTYTPPAERASQKATPATAPRTSAAATQRPVTGGDPYQTRGRVWPD
jgi:hypothetical protein